MILARRFLLAWMSLHCFFWQTSLPAEPVKKNVVLNHPPFPSGMFNMFSVVTGFLTLLEWGYLDGLRVDFGQQGAYYEPTHGSNWWQYYCEPIDTGNPQLPFTISCGLECIEKEILRDQGIGTQQKCIHPSSLPEFYLTRQEVFSLIQKYIKIKEHIHQKVAAFAEKQFDNHQVIGIHYRGTDKKTEAPRVSYETVVRAVLNYTVLFNSHEFKIFVATDEQPFLEYMKRLFPGHVLYQQAIRSSTGDPVHLYNSNPYQQGEEAMIDCLLLSRCDCLIRTSSSLSLWSSFFNPTLLTIELNHRYPWKSN